LVAAIDGGRPAPGRTEQPGELVVTDVAAVPDEPPPDLVYSHRPRLLRSARTLIGRADIVYTLAERDIRAQYKQAVLGIGWAFVNPIMTLLVFLLLTSKVPTLKVPGQPQALTLYIGILTWGFFSGSVMGASGSLLSNKLMMAKTHFPRECFPLAQVVESGFTTALATLALVGLFVIEYFRIDFVPKLATLWVPLYIGIAIPFAIGVALTVSSLIVQMRDLNQVVPIFMPLAMLCTPVIWPFSKLSSAVQPVYSFFNPLGPVINDIRGSMLQNYGPQWGLLAIAACGSALCLAIGYALFKRLEVSFADLA
jgi:ABC-type polysaccharide/polyol phosphate export permease